MKSNLIEIEQRVNRALSDTSGSHILHQVYRVLDCKESYSDKTD